MHHAVDLLDFPVDAFLHNSLAINPAFNKTGLLVTGRGSERYFINYMFTANRLSWGEAHSWSKTSVNASSHNERGQLCHAGVRGRTVVTDCPDCTGVPNEVVRGCTSWVGKVENETVWLEDIVSN